jgi:hypothetical protein
MKAGRLALRTWSRRIRQKQERRKALRQGFADRDRAVANRFRAKLEELYGQDRAARVQHAEAFEICEYGRRRTRLRSGSYSLLRVTAESEEILKGLVHLNRR